MFKPIPSPPDFIQIEERVLKFWRENKIFQKILAQSQIDSTQRSFQPTNIHRSQFHDNNQFIRHKPGSEYKIYETTNTANHKPSLTDLLLWTIEDVYIRYHRMLGKQIIHRFTWDTLSMTLEDEIQKRQGISKKLLTEKMGIERFNELCHRAAFDYIYDWEKTAERGGIWIDWQDACVTQTNEYIESTWWAIKTFWEKGFLDKTTAVFFFCPSCSIPLSDLEAKIEEKKEGNPTVFVRFPLVDKENTSLLVWSSSIWELSGNIAVAVHPEEDYAIIEYSPPGEKTERLILSVASMQKVFSSFSPSFETIADPHSNNLETPDIQYGIPSSHTRVIGTLKGRALNGYHYLPLFTFQIPEKDAYYVVLNSSVDVQEGSGIIPLSPAFDNWAFYIAIEKNLPIFFPIETDGVFSSDYRPWHGKYYTEVEPFIMEDLALRGLVLKTEMRVQTVHFCPYCHKSLLKLLNKTWCLQTAEQSELLKQLITTVQWHPAHNPNQGIFSKLLIDNSLWVVGQEGYLGTPLPIWVDEDDDICVFGSREELARAAGCDLTILDLHRPAIDAITFPNPKNGKTMHRIPEVLSTWFDTGFLPFAQVHYPFENQNQIPEQLTANLIVCKSKTQLEGWFAALFGLNGITFSQPAFHHVYWIHDVHVKKNIEEAISYKRATDVKEILDSNSTDALRWYLLSSLNNCQQEWIIELQEIKTIIPKILNPLWQIYNTFLTLAGTENWDLPLSFSVWDNFPPPQGYSDNILDRWLLSSFHLTLRNISEAYDAYEIPKIIDSATSFIDQIEQWFIHRINQKHWSFSSRRDKSTTITSLYCILIGLIRALAPLIPFICEEIYQTLVCSIYSQAPPSIHLTKFPRYDDAQINEDLSAIFPFEEKVID